MRELVHHPHGRGHINERGAGVSAGTRCRRVACARPGSRWTPRSPRGRLPRTRRSQRVGAEASPAEAPQATAWATIRARTTPIPNQRTSADPGEQEVPASVVLLRDRVHGGLRGRAADPEVLCGVLQALWILVHPEAQDGGEDEPRGTSQKKSRYAIPPASSPAAASRSRSSAATARPGPTQARARSPSHPYAARVPAL